MNYSDRFRIEPGKKVELLRLKPDDTAKLANDQSVAREIARDNERIRALQYLLYAEGKQSLLICLQALDAAGKDGTINHVLGAMNPQGTRVHGFKTPSKAAAAHDFLWRIHQRTPGKGEVAIFNRSHYEDVLVVRVHKLVPRAVWSKRYDRINEFERNLVQNGTRIIKFYLHISEDEQLARFKQRLDDPARHWKISEADYSERQLWPEYIGAYEEALRKTSTKHAPWFVIPSNHKWFRNLAVSKIVAETMEAMDMKFPPPTVDIEAVRRQYHAATKGEKALEKKLAQKEKRER